MKRIVDINTRAFHSDTTVDHLDSVVRQTLTVEAGFSRLLGAVATRIFLQMGLSEIEISPNANDLDLMATAVCLVCPCCTTGCQSALGTCNSTDFSHDGMCGVTSAKLRTIETDTLANDTVVARGDIVGQAVRLLLQIVHAVTSSSPCKIGRAHV